MNAFPSLRYHRPYSTRFVRGMSLRALLLRPSYRIARKLGMNARAAFGFAKLAEDVGI